MCQHVLTSAKTSVKVPPRSIEKWKLRPSMILLLLASERLLYVERKEVARGLNQLALPTM